MSENKFYILVAKKEQLLALLNTGFIDDGAWVRFVYEAEQAGCEAMAENMSQRFIHYKKLQQLEERGELMPTYRLLFARYSWLTVTAEDEDTAIFLAEEDEDIEGHSECGWYLQQSFEMIPGTDPVIHEYAGYEELGERTEE